MWCVTCVIEYRTIIKHSKMIRLMFLTGPLSELLDINTVDGSYKLIFAINGQFPGPPIVVYEGQSVSPKLIPYRGGRLSWNFQRVTQTSVYKHFRCSDWSSGTCIQVEVSDVIPRGGPGV